MLPWWIFALSAVVLSTAFAIFRKKGLSKEHALDFAASRGLVMGILVLFLIPFVNFNLSKGIIAIIFLLSLLDVVGITFMSKAYRHTEISKISPLSSLRSVFVVILAFIFLKETIGQQKILGIGILLIGAYLLEADHHISNFKEPIMEIFRSRYNLFYLFSLFLFSIGILIIKYLVDNFLDPISLIFYLWIFNATLLNLVHGYLHGFNEIKSCFKETKGLPIIVGFFGLVAHLLALKALSLAYASLVTPTLSLSTLLIVLVGGEFFKEGSIAYRSIISIIMLFGAYLIIV